MKTCLPWVTEVHRPFYIQNSSLKFSHLLQIIILLSPGLNLYYFHCKWACKIHSAVIWGPWIPDNSGSVLNADFTSWPSVLPLPSFHVTNHLESFSPVCQSTSLWVAISVLLHSPENSFLGLKYSLKTKWVTGSLVVVKRLNFDRKYWNFMISDIIYISPES